MSLHDYLGLKVLLLIGVSIIGVIYIVAATIWSLIEQWRWHRKHNRKH